MGISGAYSIAISLSFVIPVEVLPYSPTYPGEGRWLVMMESTRLSECLQYFLATSVAVEAAHQPAWIQGTLEVVGQFFQILRQITSADNRVLGRAA